MNNNIESDSDEEILSAWSNLKSNKEFDYPNQIVRKTESTTADYVERNHRSINLITPLTPYSLIIQSLIRQLCTFIERDEAKSLDLYNKVCKKFYEHRLIDESYERSEFEEIRSSYESAIFSIVSIARENNKLDKVVEWPLSGDKKQTLNWSRYYRDFEEIEKIAQGGFGDVYKARHILDKNIYAIKKILIKSASVKNILGHLREVKTFALLNHINIVPYKSCWLEPLISENEHARFTDDESWMSKSESANIRITKSNDEEDSLRLKTNDSFSIDFEYSENHQSENEKSSLSISSHTQTNNSIGSLEKIRRLSSDSNGISKAVVNVNFNWSVLFIQMKLCQKTLRNFLDERNSCESFKSYYKNYTNLCTDNLTYTALSIFQQICNGLEYIHSNNIVHHDLKPANVFVSLENGDSSILFQLGDFGLACPLDSNEMVAHDKIGTSLYAAPEQLKGICSKKSDIYSLGIIMIELLLKFTTGMERVKKVDKIKNGEQLCEEEIEPTLYNLIRKLLNKNAELRPNIVELKELTRNLLESSSDEVSRLKNIIENKDIEIENLMIQIKNLKQKLNT